MNAPFFLTVAFFAPLVGFVLSLITHKRHHISKFLACFFMGVALLSYFALVYEGGEIYVELLRWIKVDKLRANWGLYGNSLTYVMMGVVLSVSFLVHIYALGYMAHDKSLGRFMSYLSLFTFMMLILVCAPNLLQLFVGWEGVGLASYLLIGFWYERPKASKAAIKAFVVNRVGDFGLILGICAVYSIFETLDFAQITQQCGQHQNTTMQFWGYHIHAPTLICMLLFMGAMGKSAQFGLHTWLPDAMEGPTPVSALIHAATMVTAGIFLIARLSPVFEMSPFAKDFMVLIGALTALFAASVALVQTDIKRIIAYSTCSQLGYMVLACGCGAYHIAIFHLTTHAFFKALLFLGVGSVIHAMSDDQNIMHMGGLRRHIPKTYILMWIGSLALAGVPFLAGFYSKDALLEAVYASTHPWAFWVGLVVAFLTAFYSFRLLFVCFHGSNHADEHVHAHIHESPRIMLIPLYILAVGALIAGWVGDQTLLQEHFGFHWNQSVVHVAITHTHSPVMALAITFSLLGIALAYVFYILESAWPDRLGNGPLYTFLKNTWYIDALYHRLWVIPILRLGQFFWIKGDRDTIDAFGPDGMTRQTLWLSRQNKNIQTGFVYHYAFFILIGLICFLTFFCVRYMAPQSFSFLSALLKKVVL